MLDIYFAGNKIQFNNLLPRHDRKWASVAIFVDIWAATS